MRLGQPHTTALLWVYLLIGDLECKRKRFSSVGRPADGVPQPAPRLRCSPTHGTGPPASARPQLLAGSPIPIPIPSPRFCPAEVYGWAQPAGAGMLGRAAGRNSYSPYAAGRRRTGTANSPKRSLDSLPRSPSVRLTVRGWWEGAARGVCSACISSARGAAIRVASCSRAGLEEGAAVFAPLVPNLLLVSAHSCHS